MSCSVLSSMKLAHLFAQFVIETPATEAIEHTVKAGDLAFVAQSQARQAE
jgi:hypothetical protein